MLRRQPVVEQQDPGAAGPGDVTGQLAVGDRRPHHEAPAVQVEHDLCRVGARRLHPLGGHAAGVDDRAVMSSPGGSDVRSIPARSFSTGWSPGGRLFDRMMSTSFSNCGLAMGGP